MNTSNTIGKVLRYMSDSDYRFLVNAGKFGFYQNLSDEVYIKRKFKAMMGYELDLEHPQTFNEKLQWLKLYDRNPAYTKMVDKYEAKKYVAGVIGDQYIIPTLGVWDSFDEIDFNALPDRFVLKCTHDSGGIVICKSKKDLDMAAARKKLEKSLKNDFYLSGREWPYKNVKRRIIAEKYMEDDSRADAGDTDLMDYKFMCFDGKVKCSFVCSERYSGEGLKVTFFDPDWKKLPFERHYPASKRDIPKPKSYDLMVELAERLSDAIPFVRVDFYDINGEVFFGELTFYPGGGFEEFSPLEGDYTLGSWLTLPREKRV